MNIEDNFFFFFGGTVYEGNKIGWYNRAPGEGWEECSNLVGRSASGWGDTWAQTQRNPAGAVEEQQEDKMVCAKTLRPHKAQHDGGTERRPVWLRWTVPEGDSWKMRSETWQQGVKVHRSVQGEDLSFILKAIGNYWRAFRREVKWSDVCV